jgi:rubrerythrin
MTKHLCTQSSLASIALFHDHRKNQDQEKRSARSSFDVPSACSHKRHQHPSQKQQRARELLQHYKGIYTAVKGDFLVPPHYAGHTHAWVQLDAGLCLCEVCGAEHMCFQGECPTVQMEQSELVCSISGCVIVLSELKAEWGALDRVHAPQLSAAGGRATTAASRKRALLEEDTKSATGNDAKKKKGAEDRSAHLRPSVAASANGGPQSSSLPTALHTRRTSSIHDTVETVVRELLDSPKTAQCLAEELTRDSARRHACLARLIRELISNQHLCKERPNMLHLEAKLSWHCHKCRHVHVRDEKEASCPRMYLPPLHAF